MADSTAYTNESATHDAPPLPQRVKLALLVAWGRLVARFRSKPQFGGEPVDYVIEPYNLTCANERCLELGIVQQALPTEGRVLEVGNVWGHYRKHDYTVVDKYELAPGVVNADLVDLPEDEQYDFIFSISTFEHIGWDEDPREPEKLGACLAKLRRLLAPGGRALVTVPVDWNEWLDAKLAAGELDTDAIDWYARTALFCGWENATAEQALAGKYDSPHRAANGLAVLSING